MRRRDFISLVGSAAAAWPLAARAQQADRVRRIGVLMPFAATDPAGKLELAGFARQLQDLGWTDGGNLRITYRWSAGDPERMQALAKELTALQPDVIFARSTPVMRALMKQTRTIPIVFAVVSDPVGDGFVASVARPGGNATGFTNAEASLSGKWLGLLKEDAPKMARAGYLFDPKVAPGGGSFYADTINAAAAASAGVSAAMPIHGGDDIERAIAEFSRAPDGGLIVLPDATTFFHRAQIIALAGRYRLPAIYALRNLAEEGGPMSYGVDGAQAVPRS